MSATSEFAKQLGADLSGILGGSFKYKRSRLELSRAVSEGHDVVILSVTGKYSPFVGVAFYFGKNYKQPRAIKRTLGGYQFPYHVQQYSVGRQPLFSNTYCCPDHWEINLQAPQKDLPLELARAVQGMAIPLFEKFTSLYVARDAIAGLSRDCFSGQMFWRQLLLLDASLDDLDHFRHWISCLDDWTKKEAELELLKVTEAIGRVD